MIDLSKAQIEELFDGSIASEAIRDAYIASALGRVQAPPIAQLSFPEEEGDCCVKTGHILGTAGFVVKVSTGFYRNPDQGLPSSNGMNLVFSSTTGAPLAILRDDGWLTDVRTGIGGALATVALAQPGFCEVLIVGTGLQARHQAQCLQAQIADRTLNFSVWGRDPQKAEATAQALRGQGLSAASAADLQTACGAAQAIVTCTPSKVALIEKDWIRPGTHITAIGADCPGKQELAAALTGSADLLVCDEPQQSLHHGEFQHLNAARDPIALGDILSGQHAGRSGADQITIADLTGLAVQDAAVSLAVLRAAHLSHSPDKSSHMSNPSDLILRSAAASVVTHRRIAPLIHKTPLIPSRMSQALGMELFYKTENYQFTGSFKLRGASAKLTTTPTDRPVVTASSGNHGIACSFAAQKTGHKLTVVLPENVVAQKRETIESYGTRVIIAGADSSLAEVHARQLAEEEGYTYISPYNDPGVIAGQGTIGLELLDQLPDLDNVFVSMGGGGLISGIGAVLKAFAPKIRVIGVSATNTAALAASIEAGEIVETVHYDTLADGVAGGVDEGSVTLPMASEVIDEIIHCDESEIAEALRVLAWKENMLVEGAAALALAPILRAPEAYRGQSSAVLLCGANFDHNRIKAVIG